MRIRCPHCNRRLHCPSSDVGSVIRCRRCGQLMGVAEPDSDEPTPVRVYWGGNINDWQWPDIYLLLLLLFFGFMAFVGYLHSLTGQ